MNLDIEKGRKFRSPGFELIRRLGTGARSAIWEARDKNTGRLFALKRTFKSPGDDDRYFNQATNEYEVASRLKHPAIRKIFSLNRIRSLFSIRELHSVMELCGGKTLEDDQPQSLVDLCEIFKQVASAVHEMNIRGFVHADIKPSNIVLDEKGLAKIIDLGLSCPIGIAKQRIQGTPDYMAPEQLVNWPLDARTDVYNFGASMYWVLTEQHPPTVVPHQDTSIGASKRTALPPHIVKPEIPIHLSRLVTECIKIEPSGRLGGMDAVASRLDMIIRELTRSEES